MGFFVALGDFFLVLSDFVCVLKVFFESLTFSLVLRFSPERETPMAEEGGVPKESPGGRRNDETD
jgi:hypothetical protein